MNPRRVFGPQNLTRGLAVVMILLDAFAKPYSLHAEATKNTGIEVHFCPAAPLWTYPLDETHGVHSLLLQSAAVINHGATFVISSVEIELLDHQQVKDRRLLTTSDIQGLAAASPQLMSLLRSVPLQFCGTEMLRAGAILAGPRLEQGQAVMVLQEPFAFTGKRDTLRLIAHGKRSGRAVSDGADIPIAAGFPPSRHVFPLEGVFYIANSPSMHTAHRWTPSEEFAYDIEKIDADGNSHSGSGSRFEDYYAYGSSIVAMAAGKVIDVVNDEPENPAAMIQPEENKETYFARLQKDQAQRVERGIRGLAGNYVLIDEGGSSFAWYAHLQPGSVFVRKGDSVTAKQAIGKLGGSGNSTEPHLHVQLCRGSDPLLDGGLPLTFTNITLPQADLPRAIQTGDVVVAH